MWTRCDKNDGMFGLKFCCYSNAISSKSIVAALEGDHDVASARAVELLHNDNASEPSKVALYS